MNKKYLFPLFATFLCWGSMYIVSKMVMGSIPPITLLALRYLVAIPALLLLLKLRQAIKPVAHGDRKIIFLIGFFGYFSSFCLQMLGINQLTGSMSSLLGAMNPVFIPILAALFLGERLTLSKIACVIISMIGVIIIVGVGGPIDPLGVAFMLLSVFLWSSVSILIRSLGGKYDPMQITMQAMIAALPFTCLCAYWETSANGCIITLQSMLAVLFLGLFNTALGHSLWNYSLSKLNASFCSMFYPLQPLISTLLGIVILNEKITTSFLLGGTIICCGIVAAVIYGKDNS